MPATQQRTAIIIGSTGITGAPLLEKLCLSDQYNRVFSFSRSTPKIENSKLESHLVDFEKVDEWSELIKGDDLFSALGTTRKQAGSIEAQYRIDHNYQVNVIKAAAQNGVKRLFLVSSPNADVNSRLFYPRMKGDIEEAARHTGIETKVFIRPSVITGNRPDNRVGEKMGEKTVNGFRYLAEAFPFKSLKSVAQKYRPISGVELAEGILKIAESELKAGQHIIEFDQIPR